MKSPLKKYIHYSGQRLLDNNPKAKYYVIIGERSNGKTYWALEYALREYKETKKQFAYVRRWDVDVKASELNQLFEGHIKNRVVERLFAHDPNRWNSIIYKTGHFYLRHIDDDPKLTVVADNPIGHVFSISAGEHKKSYSYGEVTTVIFDEFLTRTSYLPNEPVLFQNLLSTIIRLRDDVRVFMLGNTVNKWCPYFAVMGLTHVKEQKQGTIDTYHYGDSELEVAVEYCESSQTKGGKASDVYFAFDNPQLAMVKDGSWEVAEYPKLRTEYKTSDIIATFYVEFAGDTLKGIVVANNTGAFVFIKRANITIRDDEGKRKAIIADDIIYVDKHSADYRELLGVTHQPDKLSNVLLSFMGQNRFYYSDNDVGEIWRNYVMWSDNLNIRNA